MINLQASVSNNDVKLLILNQVLINDIGKANIYLSNQTVSMGSKVTARNENVSSPYLSSWVAFVDDHPFDGWNHNCRYVFVDSINGAYSIVDASIHPYNWGEYTLISNINYPAIPQIELPPVQHNLQTRIDNPHLFAIMINGTDGNVPDYPTIRNSEIRFWNNLSAMYCALRDIGFAENNIYVHSANGDEATNYGTGSPNNSLQPLNRGVDLDKLGSQNDIRFPATLPSINNTFATLQNMNLNSDDVLFVFTTGHGGSSYQDPGAALNLWDYNCLSGTHLKELLDGFPNIGQIVVVMSQCGSGGFISIGDSNQPSISGPNRTIITSVDWNELARAEMFLTLSNEDPLPYIPGDIYNPPGYGPSAAGLGYDEFVYYFTSAIRGYYPARVGVPLTINEQQYTYYKNIPWQTSNYEAGEFPFSNYPGFGPTVTYPHPSDYTPTHFAGQPTLWGAFNYANNWDTTTGPGTEENPNYWNPNLPQNWVGYDFQNVHRNPQYWSNGNIFKERQTLISMDYNLNGFTVNTGEELSLYAGTININTNLNINGHLTLSNTALNVNGTLNITGGQITLLNNASINLNSNSQTTISNGSINIISAHIHVYANSILNLSNNSHIILNSNSNLFAEAGSQMHISNSELELNGSSLIFFDNSSIELSNSSRINLVSNSILQLDAGSSIIGSSGGGWINPNTGIRYDTLIEAQQNFPNAGAEHYSPGDRIEVNNSVINANGSLNNPVIISSNNNVRWDGIYFSGRYGNYVSNINRCRINNIVDINLDNASVFIKDTEIWNTGQLSAYNSSILKYGNINYHHNDGGIYISSSSFEPQFNNLSQIHDNLSNGITFNYISNQSVLNNTYINNNAGSGISVHNCHITVDNCNIMGNLQYGYMSLSGLTNNITNCNFQDNGRAEIISLRSSFPTFSPTNLGNIHSDINDSSISQEPGDQYILMAVGQPIFFPDGSPAPIKGYGIQTTADLDTRLLPIRDQWVFSEPIGFDVAESMYRNSISCIVSQGFIQAIDTLKTLISQYPDSEYAKKALILLPYIYKTSNGSFEALQIYIDQIQNDNLDYEKLQAEITIKISEKQFMEAISKLEIIINNPPDDTKRLLAEIDEAYCYYMKVTEGIKAEPEHCTFKPNNFAEFAAIRDMNYDLLLNNSDPNAQNSSVVTAVMSCSNYPNPFNNQVSINYTMPKEAVVEITVYNSKGQKVKTLVNGNSKAGVHKAVWNGCDQNGKSLSSGIYFYKVTTSGKTITRKMVLMK